MKENLERITDSFADIIEKLSEITGKSVDYIEANFTEMVMEYGKYALWENMTGVDFAAGIILILAIGLICSGIIWLINSDCGYLEKKSDTHYIRNRVLTFGGTAILVFGIGAIPILRHLILYAASPEVYSVKAVMKLLGSL